MYLNFAVNICEKLSALEIKIEAKWSFILKRVSCSVVFNLQYITKMQISTQLVLNTEKLLKKKVQKTCQFIIKNQ